MDRSLQKKAALYIRVSTEEQAAEGQSPGAQAEVLKQYCKALGMEIYRIYEDLGYSGKSFRDRPGLNNLLSDSGKGLFDVVLVWKISRLSRNLKDLLFILEILEKNGVTFSSYTEKFDTDTPVGRMTLQLLGSIAEFERNTIVENVKLGLREFYRKGGKTGTVLGYDNIGGKLIVNRKEAEAIRKVFDMYVNNGMSYSEIAHTINRLGYKTKRGCSFRGGSIAQILGNPVYIGLNRYNAGKPDEYAIQGNHSPIIEHETWYKAQNLRKKSKNTPSCRKKEKNILAGLVTCGTCGLPMHVFYSASGGKSYRYYRCSRKSSSGSECSTYINADKLEAEVIKLLKAVLCSQTVIRDIEKLIADSSVMPLLEKKKEAASLAKEIRAYKKSMERYIKLFENCRLPSDRVFVERMEELGNIIAELENKKAIILEEIEQNAQYDIQTEYRNAFREISACPEITVLSGIIPYLIKNITVHGKEADIQTCFPLQAY